MLRIHIKYHTCTLNVNQKVYHCQEFLNIFLFAWISSDFSYLCLFASSSSARLAASRESPATRMLVTNSLPSCFNFVNLRRLCSTCFLLLLSSSLTSFFSLGSSPNSALQRKKYHIYFFVHLIQ